MLFKIEDYPLVYVAQPQFQQIKYEAPIKLFDRVSDQIWAIFLDSANYEKPFQETNRYSYIVFSPFKTFTLKNGILLEDQTPIKDSFELLQDYLQRFKSQKIDELPPFQGGLAGYFAYDMCHYLEKIPFARNDDMDFPDFAIGFYDTVISFDHLTKKCWVLSTGFPETEPNLQKLRSQTRLDEILSLLDKPSKASQENKINILSAEITANFNRESYKNSVQQIKNYILEGDVFEVNLSQRFQTVLLEQSDPYLLYKK